jgi:hypothetical protein
MMSFASKSKAALKGDFSDDSYFANVKLRIQDLAHAVRRRVFIAIAPGRDVKLDFVYCWLWVLSLFRKSCDIFRHVMFSLCLAGLANDHLLQMLT